MLRHEFHLLHKGYEIELVPGRFGPNSFPDRFRVWTTEWYVGKVGRLVANGTGGWNDATLLIDNELPDMTHEAVRIMREQEMNERMLLADGWRYGRWHMGSVQSWDGWRSPDGVAFAIFERALEHYFEQKKVAQ